jgi:hypothetical protein
LDSFGVNWGGDGKPPERDGLDLLVEEIPWGETAIEKIKQGLPELRDNLDECLNDWENLYPKEK